MTSKPGSWIALSATALLLMSACGGARQADDAGAEAGGGDGDSFTIKFSHVVTEQTPKGQAAEKFKEIVEAETDGGVSVEIYPNSSLYGDKDELQALQSDAVQMLAPSGAKFSTVAPQLQVLDLPYIVESPEQMPEVFNPDTVVGQAIYENEDLKGLGIKVLGLWDNGIKHVSSNHEMHDPSDLAGLTFRIQSSDILRSMIEAWGGTGTPMSFSEVYTSLQQGVIDAQENTYSSMESQKMHTVQDYIAETNHGYVGYILVIDQDFFDSLPADYQEAVLKAAEESTAYNREIAAQFNADSKQAIIDAGTTEIIELTDEESQAFEDAVVPSVWKEYEDVVGPEIIEELLANRE
ncbi:DctP family TRAP transporter solute-binding subunit [Ornithinimicrobium faecis]|uniref:DctP family TRAP transporter solute-binding subunit n=1 Tax=Ornithinimicrobium faecis TaxID=2934158 RepID=UPI0021176422|nr:DctP family TRAP transporter solute-binding subunit [Ornithinimicrobium sp. HY1745]